MKSPTDWAHDVVAFTYTSTNYADMVNLFELAQRDAVESFAREAAANFVKMFGADTKNRAHNTAILACCNEVERLAKAGAKFVEALASNSAEPPKCHADCTYKCCDHHVHDDGCGMPNSTCDDYPGAPPALDMVIKPAAEYFEPATPDEPAPRFDGYADSRGAQQCCDLASRGHRTGCPGKPVACKHESSYSSPTGLAYCPACRTHL